MDNSSFPQVQNAERAMPDTEYYFDIVVFQVGDTIFRVPKCGFIVPGTVFEAMFSLPSMGDIEGLSDQNPIKLPIQEETFREFLHVLYPLNLNGLHTISNADWLGTLELSTLWMFDEMRNRSIQALEPCIADQNAKEVVLLAKKYRVPKWLKDGYTRLLQQPSLIAAELRATPALDWETIAKLLSAKILSASPSQCRGACHDFARQNWSSFRCANGTLEPVVTLLSAIEQEFREELSDMSDNV